MTPREAITAAGIEAEYQAGNYAAVVIALNDKSLIRYDKVVGGWDKCETAGLTGTEIGVVVTTIRAVAYSDSEYATLAMIGLEFFLQAKLDFSRDDSQFLFSQLPTISGGAVTEEVAAKLAAVGRQSESYADQLNDGVDFTESDISKLAARESREALIESYESAIGANVDLHTMTLAEVAAGLRAAADALEGV